MRKALAIAEEALAAGEVPVGCVLVSGAGEVVGTAGNETVVTRNPTRHCEIVTMGNLASVDAAWGATLYVTVEPCIMCAAALCYARVGACCGAAAPRRGEAAERRKRGATLFPAPQAPFGCAARQKRARRSGAAADAAAGRVVFGCANPRFGGVDSVYRVPEMDIGRGATSYETRSGGACAAEGRRARRSLTQRRSAGRRGGRAAQAVLRAGEPAGAAGEAAAQGRLEAGVAHGRGHGDGRGHRGQGSEEKTDKGGVGIIRSRNSLA